MSTFNQIQQYELLTILIEEIEKIDIHLEKVIDKVNRLELQNILYRYGLKSWWLVAIREAYDEGQVCVRLGMSINVILNECFSNGLGL